MRGALALAAPGLLLAGIISPALRGADGPPALPPVPPRPGAAEGPTEVGYAVWIVDVTRIDSADQTFEAGLVVVLRWRDPSLAHAGPGAKRYAVEDIWHPRLLVANEAEEISQSLSEVAEVAPDGTAVWRQRFMGRFAEALNLHAFPFDRDTFRISFVVPGRTPEEIRFVPDAGAEAPGLKQGIGMAERPPLFALVEIQPFDLSPQTRHLECVVTVERE
jgi:hypothetical protein